VRGRGHPARHGCGRGGCGTRLHGTQESEVGRRQAAPERLCEPDAGATRVGHR
jgi:hypothetical protein